MKVYSLSALLFIIFSSFFVAYGAHKSKIDTIISLGDSQFENIANNFSKNLKQNSSQNRAHTDCLSVGQALQSKNGCNRLKEITFYSILKAYAIFHMSSFEINNSTSSTLERIDRANIYSLAFMIKFLCLDLNVLIAHEKKDFRNLLEDISSSASCCVGVLQHTASMYSALKRDISSISFETDSHRLPILKTKSNHLLIQLKRIALKIEKIAQHPLFEEIFESINYLQLLNKQKITGNELSKKWDIFFDSVERFCERTIPQFQSGASCKTIWQTFGGYLICYIDVYCEQTIQKPIQRARQLVKQPKEYSDKYCVYFLDPLIQKKYAQIIKRVASLLDFSKFRSAK